jgi:hypothetical protein
MEKTLLTRADPVAAYRGLCAALHADHGWIADRHWLRFAAQAAALRPEAPEETARSIHAYLDDLLAARKIMHGLGLPHSNWYELKTITAMHMIYDGGPVASSALLQRLADIYAGMRRYHWWSTGRHELPACALLTACTGDTAAVVGQAEAVGTALVAEHLGHGHAVQTASGILPLAGVSAGAVFQRCDAIFRAMTAIGLPRSDDALVVAAMLSLLDHDPVVIANRVNGIINQLTDPDHPAYIGAEIAVAADLAFLDLLRCDAHGNPLATVADDERIRRLTRLQRAISVVIAEVPVEPASAEWPMMPFA